MELRNKAQQRIEAELKEVKLLAIKKCLEKQGYIKHQVDCLQETSKRIDKTIEEIESCDSAMDIRNIRYSEKSHVSGAKGIVVAVGEEAANEFSRDPYRNGQTGIYLGEIDSESKYVWKGGED